MRTFEEELFSWLSLPKGTKKAGTELVEFLKLAETYTGDDDSIVDSYKVCLEEYTDLPKQEIANRVKKVNMIRLLGGYPKDFEGYVDLYTKKMGVSYGLDKSLKMNNEDHEEIELIAKMNLLAQKVGAYKDRQCIKDAWELWKIDTGRKNKKKFIEKIAYRKEADESSWDKIIDAIVLDDGSIPQYKELCKIVLKSFVWRVKRKVMGDHPSNHIMPYLRSKQGSGKTTFMNWFFSGIEEGVLKANFSIFEHDENLLMMSTMPIVMFDECAKADKQDAATIKNYMTTNHSMLRRLYSSASKVAIISTFFGGGNMELSEVFTDTTGSRRFFQVEVKPNLYEMNGVFASINPMDLWHSVNEFEPCLLDDLNVIKMLQVAQVTQKNATPVERWLDSVCSDGGSGDYKDFEEHFKSYQSWAMEKYPKDKMDVNSFQRQFLRLLKDQSFGEYPYLNDKKHWKTKRVMYKLLGRVGTEDVDSDNVISLEDAKSSQKDKLNALKDKVKALGCYE